MLSEKEKAFLRRRARLNRTWKWVGPVLLALPVILIMWLMYFSPRLVNPLLTARRIQEGTLGISAMQTMALLLPAAFLMLILICMVVVIYVFAFISTERQYWKIIDRLMHGPEKNADPLQQRCRN